MNAWRVVLFAAVLLSIVGMALTSALPVFPGSWEGRPRWAQEHRRWLLAGSEERGQLENFGLELASLLSQYLTGVVMIYLLPGRIRRVGQALRNGPRAVLRYLGIGFLLVIALASIGLLSALAVYTFPLPFILLAIIFLAALGGTVALNLALGSALLRRADWGSAGPLSQLALGTLLLFGAAHIPYVGLAVLVIAALIGAGAATATHFGTGRTWSLSPLTDSPQTEAH